MTLNATLRKAAAGMLCTLAFQSAAFAGDPPGLSPTLKKMLGNLPIAGMKDEVHGLVAALKKTSCGGGLKGCYAVKQGDLQLYYLTDGKEQQTFLLVLDTKVGLPKLLKDNVQKALGGTTLQSPMISISTVDYTLAFANMPPDLQAIAQSQYFGIGAFDFSSGVQLAARANLAGAMKATMATLGVQGDQLVMRAAVAIPVPTDLASGAGTGIGLAAALHEGTKFQDAATDALKPQAFVEFQFAPNTVVKMAEPRMTLSDSTFFLDNELVFGYKGNAVFDGTGKPLLLQFQTPLNPEGALDFLDFSFRMATPADFTLQDAAKVMVDMETPNDARFAKYGGGFIGGIGKYKSALLSVTEPLAVFQLQNPNPAPAYRFGDPTKPFPTDPNVFNVQLYGPTAQGGPYLHLAGNVRILGETMGKFDASVGASGLHGSAVQDLQMKLGPLGRVKVEKVVGAVDVDAGQQRLALDGNFAGQAIDVAMSGATLAVAVPATCTNPFEIKARVGLQAGTKLDDVMNAQGGANVDPSSIAGCVGKDLQAALRKVSGEYAGLPGYTAAAASKALNQALNGDPAYKATKDAARLAASKTNSAFTNAFEAAGNAFRKLGIKKHKNHAPPDPKFHESVFDWDDYYDFAPDVVAAHVDLATHWANNGFNEGRQGSVEFQAPYYWNRYADVQALCPGPNLQCAVQHWVNVGIDEGRQGSAQFAVADYLDRYPDLQAAFGRSGWGDAMDHWINNGQDEGRDGHPNAILAGPINGPVLSGGTGGTPWSDADVCQGQPVTGFRVQAGNNVDGVQFQYGGSRWGAVHGVGNRWSYEIAFQPGEYVVRVDYRSDGGMNHAVGFVTNMNHGYGMFGGAGGTFASFYPTPGQYLGCMSGRAGSSVDQMIFASTGPR